MRILALSAQLPFPPHHGKAMRDYALLTGLAAHHEVHLLAFASSQEIETARPLATQVPFQALPRPAHRLPRRLLLLVTGQPDLVGRTWSWPFLRMVHRALEEEPPNVLLVEGLEMASYGLRVAAAFRGKVTLPWVLDEHNAEYLLQRRAWEIARRDGRGSVLGLYSRLQAGRLARFEARACLAADEVIAVSEGDRDALWRVAPGARITVVPNGVDTEHYLPLSGDRPPQPPTLVFSGRMDFRPNVDAVLWFCREIWPRIRAQTPDARFCIVGREPTTAVRALAEIPGVQVVGAVPDDRPWIGGADLYVLPMRFGGGVRFKLLQALAMARATVSTPLGAEGVEGLVDGEHIALAGSAEQFAEQVLRLLSDAEARERMGQAGRALVVARYDWRVLLPRFEAALRRAVERARGKEPGCGSP